MKSEYLTLSDLGRVLKKRWMPILAVTLILAVLVAGGGLLFHAVWESTSVFYVRNFQSDAYLEQYGLTSSQLAVIQTLAKDYAELLPQSDVFLDRVVERAGVVGLDRSTLRDCLRALPDGTSFRVTVSHTDAQLALHLSRVIEQEVPLYIQETVWPNLQSAHTSVTLLRASEGAVKVFPRPALFGSIAAAAGALLTYIYFLLRFLFGNRLEDEEEIVRALPDVPLLSSLTLPHSGADDALTALIHLGYLGYDENEKTAFIPNYEVKEAYQSALSKGKWSEISRSISRCEELLFATIRGNSDRVAELLELSHETYTSVVKYNDENSLSCAITMAYFTAPAYYTIIRELPAGKGFADIALIPRADSGNKPAMIIELKWDKDADTAIKQIKEKRYTGALSGYSKEILLVGVNYDKETKKHECVIEKTEIEK